MLHPKLSVKCPICQTDNPETNNFCRECGTKLSHLCPKCGAESDVGDKFCGGCGEGLAAKQETAKTKLRGKVVPLKRGPTARHRLSELRADFVGHEIAVDKARENGSCRTIAICNQKGGVGKTVTAINLSARLAALGLRTLLVDLDPQGQSGLGLGVDVDSLDRSVYDVLMNGSCAPDEAIVPLRPNLEILPSNIDLTSAELDLASFEKRERRLKEVIDGLRESYDYIVIDCPPSIGILT
ncbi:MAG: AAA family ATPase, partial [Proteobacteria bacterium]|nr:AAA family ATPase [Pseudomonadota bacterium]